MSDSLFGSLLGWGMFCLFVALVAAVLMWAFSDGNKYPRFQPAAGTSVRPRSHTDNPGPDNARPD